MTITEQCQAAAESVNAPHVIVIALDPVNGGGMYAKSDVINDKLDLAYALEVCRQTIVGKAHREVGNGLVGKETTK